MKKKNRNKMATDRAERDATDNNDPDSRTGEKKKKEVI